MKLADEEIKAFGKEDALNDHQKIIDTEIEDGDEIIINWEHWHIKNNFK